MREVKLFRNPEMVEIRGSTYSVPELSKCFSFAEDAVGNENGYTVHTYPVRTVSHIENGAVVSEYFVLADPLLNEAWDNQFETALMWSRAHERLRARVETMSKTFWRRLRFAFTGRN